ncbi:MAG: cell division inhibitor SepF [Clostridiales bacterium]|jgi:cell division inhibitor SepF|nr:cell division protein SepF [Eubacteriales bacterium]MDD3196964.1 cell division protein SepF [Eubacteriales bacterium]MDD3502645.1 cell division protein SepF [Eubacteriales bacterium]MDD4681707.1 cell division protein SepF [Eubacteriales bacterium]MDN5315529.1 cell division inhibitor SepF [Clostridiales bacterium]
MAAILDRIFNRFGNYDDEYAYEDSYEQEMYEEPVYEEEIMEEEPMTSNIRRPQASSRVVDFKSGSQQQVVVMQPADIESAQQACDHIRSGKTVICNIEKVDPKVAQRVIDFITGAAYALDGKVLPVSSVIFVVAPRNTSLLEGGITGQSMDYVQQHTAAK